MMLQQGQDMRVCNINSTHEGRRDTIDDTIDNESYDVDVHNDNDDEVDDGDDGKCNANNDDNDVEDNDDEMIIAIPMIIQ